MAVMYIQEYAGTGMAAGGSAVQVGQEPKLAGQAVTFTTTTASAAFNADTELVRIVCDAAAHIEFGSSAPTATTSHAPIAANTPEYFGVKGGHFVAAVTQ